MSKSARSTARICGESKRLINLLKPRYGTSDTEVMKQALVLLWHVDVSLHNCCIDFSDGDSLASKPETNQP